MVKHLLSKLVPSLIRQGDPSPDRETQTALSRRQLDLEERLRLLEGEKSLSELRPSSPGHD